jgi:hypothetical protein
MDYPVEKHGIRFYNYYFYNLTEPVKIEARSKKEARQILDANFANLPVEYRQSKIVGESVVIPLKGISEKMIGGVKFIWVGEDIKSGGWMDETSYLAMVSTK